MNVGTGKRLTCDAVLLGAVAVLCSISTAVHAAAPLEKPSSAPQTASTTAASPQPENSAEYIHAPAVDETAPHSAALEQAPEGSVAPAAKDSPEQVIVPTDEAPEPTLEPAATVEQPRPDSRQMRAFRTAIEDAESAGGAYASMLPEQLLGLGLALQREGRHTDAIEVFKRGSHLTRINNGLYSAAQIPFLERQISSHLALGEFTEADEGQARLFRVQQRSLARNSNLAEALMKQARWQHRAYKLGIGGEEMGFTRLLNMWDLNRMALTTVMDNEGDKSPRLLPPLYALLQAQYLISGHKDRSKTANFDFSSEGSSKQTYNRFNSYLAKSYDKGRSIIGAIYDIQSSQYGAQSLPAIEAKIMLGDWMLWHGVRDQAMAVYTEAAGELARLDDAQLHTRRLLGEPVPLPDLDGVRPLLPEVSAQEGNILVEFGVTERGRVRDVVRLREDEDGAPRTGDAADGKANRLLRVLRKTRFRPRFVDGQPVPTENIVKAYVIEQ